MAVLFFILAVLCHSIALYLPRVYNKTKNMKYMKEMYEAPEVQVIDMELQGMIAASLGKNDDYGQGGNGITFP